jgi:3-oxoacyl-[acyl-carrier-protein] synthase III
MSATERKGEHAVIGPDRIAITGIGATEQGEIPGQTANEIALRAAVAAIADAGIDKSAIDGLVTCQPPLSAERAGLDEDMGQLLGINPSFSSTLQYGACGFSLHLAATAIASGMATTVLLTRPWISVIAERVYRAAGVSAGDIALRDPQVRHRDMVVTAPHRAGVVRLGRKND